jgi:transposase InsO family protein
VSLALIEVAPTMLRAICCCEAFESTREAQSSPRSSGCSANAACRWRSTATTDCRSPVPTASTISPAYRSGWLRLGIAIERIKPGHPQQNGRHERMHLTLKKEATRPPGSSSKYT